mgnify:CR=1 FL=1
MNIKNYILIASLACACSSCELLQPNEIINPNVDEDTFLKTPNAMSTWVNGSQPFVCHDYRFVCGID